MRRRTFLGLLGLLGCKDELENMNIPKKNWWSGGGGAAYDAAFTLCSDINTTNDAQAYALDATYDNNVYYFNATLNQKPSDESVILNVFTRGVDHVEDATKKLVYRKSTNTGSSWGTETDLYDPTGTDEQVQDPGVGYDRGGRFHIMADVHTSVGVTGGTHKLMYMYSDDDLTTISSPVEITLPSNGLATFRIYGKMIDIGNRTLLFPCYFVTDEGDSSESMTYVIKSTDRGSTWSFIPIKPKDTRFINETSLLHISGNIIIAVSRDERFASNTIYAMYKSYDAGETWEYCGNIGGTGTIPGPCRLNKFKDDSGRYIAEMSWMVRDTTKKIHAMYGYLNDFEIGGAGAWVSTTYDLATFVTNHPNYGDLCHYNCTMNAIGCYPEEINFPTDNRLNYITCAATQYDTVIASIDFTKSDNLEYLKSIQFIGSSRGLVSNTTNDYGIVDSSARVTTLKSIAPGPLNQNFTATAGGITLSGGSMVYDGTKALTHGTASYFNFMSYSSVSINDVNWTIHFVAKFGTASDPNTFYSAFGNYAGSAANKGTGMLYDDRVSVPRSNAFVFNIADGDGSFTVAISTNDLITPNEFHVYSIQVDLSEPTTNNKVKFYIDGVLKSTTIGTYNATIANTPTYSMQIGALGNNVGIMVGSMRDIIIQNGIEPDTFRDLVIDDLIATLP